MKRMVKFVGFAAFSLLVAVVTSGCHSDPIPTANAAVSSRDPGVPAPDQLDDLNKWVEDVAVIEGDVSFETASAELSDEGEEILRGLAAHLQETKGKILVEGFADGVGGRSRQNVDLSKDRARSVKAWLTETYPELKGRFLPIQGHGASGIVNNVKAREGIADARRRAVQITVEDSK